jgi:hypothetical protein
LQNDELIKEVITAATPLFLGKHRPLLAYIELQTPSCGDKN